MYIYAHIPCALRENCLQTVLCDYAMGMVLVFTRIPPALGENIVCRLFYVILSWVGYANTLTRLAHLKKIVPSLLSVIVPWMWYRYALTYLGHSEEVARRRFYVIMPKGCVHVTHSLAHSLIKATLECFTI